MKHPEDEVTPEVIMPHPLVAPKPYDGEWLPCRVVAGKVIAPLALTPEPDEQIELNCTRDRTTGAVTEAWGRKVKVLDGSASTALPLPRPTMESSQYMEPKLRAEMGAELESAFKAALYPNLKDPK